jgi:hypothetical protein
MMQCYHKPCDNLETLLTNDNINFLGKTADVTDNSLYFQFISLTAFFMPPEIIFLSSAKQNIQAINILEYFRMIIQLLPSYEGL